MHPQHRGAEEISIANKWFFDLAKQMQNLFLGGAAPTAERYGRLRLQMQHVLNINQVWQSSEAGFQTLVLRQPPQGRRWRSRVGAIDTLGEPLQHETAR